MGKGPRAAGRVDAGRAEGGPSGRWGGRVSARDTGRGVLHGRRPPHGRRRGETLPEFEEERAPADPPWLFPRPGGPRGTRPGTCPLAGWPGPDPGPGARPGRRAWLPRRGHRSGGFPPGSPSSAALAPPVSFRCDARRVSRTSGAAGRCSGGERVPGRPSRAPPGNAGTGAARNRGCAPKPRAPTYVVLDGPCAILTSSLRPSVTHGCARGRVEELGQAIPLDCGRDISRGSRGEKM